MMDQYLVKNVETRLCSFASKAALYSLLDISPRCGYAPGVNPHASRKSRCTRSLEEWKRTITETLLSQLAVTNIPSIQASHMLEQLSKNRICGSCQEHAFQDSEAYTEYCSRLTRDWRGNIWREYLREIGVYSEDALEMLPGSLAPSSWNHMLDGLTRTGGNAAMTVTMRSNEQKKVGRQTRSNAPRGLDHADMLQGTLGDDPFTDDSSVKVKKEASPDGIKPPAKTRPPLHRGYATKNVSKISSLGQSASLGADNGSLQNEVKTPVKEVVPSCPTDDASSPESVTSVVSSVFDVEKSPDADTPLSISEISPVSADGEPGSEGSIEQQKR